MDVAFFDDSNYIIVSYDDKMNVFTQLIQKKGQDDVTATCLLIESNTIRDSVRKILGQQGIKTRTKPLVSPRNVLKDSV